MRLETKAGGSLAPIEESNNPPMRPEGAVRYGKWLVFAYLVAAAGYGGWCGDDLGSGWGLWLIGLVPLALAAVVFVVEMRRQPSAGLAFAVSLAPMVACVFIAVCGLGAAWLFAVQMPATLGRSTRAAIAAAAAAAGAGLTFAFYRPPHPAAGGPETETEATNPSP